MKYCEKFAALLDPYVDGELTGEESARVRAHLADCPSCRDYVDGALAIRAAFPEVEETAVPEGFAAGVMAGIRELEAAGGKEPHSGAGRHTPWGAVLLPLAACFALVLVLRAVPGGGSAGGSLNAAKSAPMTAADSAAPAGDSGSQHSLTAAAPQIEAAGDTPAEEDAAPAPSSRIITEAPAAPAVLQSEPSAVFDGGLEETAVPQPEEGTAAASAFGLGGAAAPGQGRAIRLTADQAGELLADLPYTAGEDGVRCYQLPGGDFDALLTALAERDILPQEEEAELECLPEGYDLVYVTEE